MTENEISSSIVRIQNFLKSDFMVEYLNSGKSRRKLIRMINKMQSAFGRYYHQGKHDLDRADLIVALNKLDLELVMVRLADEN